MGQKALRRIPRFLQQLFLLRGESQIASTGLILAAILLFVMGTCAWWSVSTQRKGLEQARQKQVESVGESLAETTAILIGLDELSTVRRLLMEAGHNQKFSEARIVLPGGKCIAHTDVAQINQSTVPETWPLGSVQAVHLPEVDGEVTLNYPMAIPGRGSARLDLRAPVTAPVSVFWDALAGVGLIGALALVALLIVYRQMRSKVRSLGVIREALISLRSGDGATRSLHIADELGPEAVAWNALMVEKQELEKQLLSRRVGEVITTRRKRSGDLEGACDLMRQGIVLVDRHLEINYTNGAAAVFLRSTDEDLESAKFSELLDDEAVLRAVRDAISGENRTWQKVEVEQKGDHGNAVLRFSVRPLRNDDSAAALIAIDDVTQQRIAEESRNAFVAQVTHELRTPLTNIRLYVESAIEDGESRPETKHALNVINQEAKRLERIVGDMLSVSEMEAGSYELMSDDLRLETVFDELQSHYGAYANEKNINLVFDLPPKLPVIQADRDKVIMALHNLVGNAVKYTPNAGRVDVKVDVDADGVWVEVSDNGIGIKPEEQERIFEKFYRASDTRVADETGSGLGLALARNVIRMHGGDITVDSHLNEGSTFRLTLPNKLARAA